MKSWWTLVFCSLYAILNAQYNPDKPNLCQGQFYTPEQAKAKLNELSSLYEDASTWEAHAARLRQGILDGAEITTLQFNREVQPVIHSKKIANGYTVENVYFESVPGLYVTGNLYRPADLKGKVPGILCPHGHSQDGRFQEYTQQRCATLARMGAVVFAYDMIGMGDSKQCDHKLSKAFKFQLLNSVRALDFLSSLPEIDTNRLAITGESGGGTQTFMLTAVDPRIDVAVPVVMVSAHFFGGCICESGMPVYKRPDHQTNNAEIAALAAPRPLLLISDGADWTALNPELEYPFIRRIYTFYHAEDRIKNDHFAEEKHDYGPNKRLAAYHFLAKFLGLDPYKVMKDGIIDESVNAVFSPEALSVFDDAHRIPASAAQGNAQVLQALDAY